MKTVTLWAVLAVMLGVAARAADPPVKPPDPKLLGVYRVVSGERNGQSLEPARLQNISLQIAADAITTFDQNKKAVYAATYDLDATKKPWRITLTATVTPDASQGAVAEGLIERDGDTVRLIYALPGGAVPTVMKTADKQQMFVLKKVNE